MTTPAHSPAIPAEGCDCAPPQDTTNVLIHRELVSGTDSNTTSVFGDDVWDLTPGVFEAHSNSLTLNFTTRPEPLRTATKYYFWHLINHRCPAPLRGANTTRLALRSTSYALGTLTVFLNWLDVRSIVSFDQVTHTHLDQFLENIQCAEYSLERQGELLTEVRRLWCYRTLLPDPMRLPAQQLWDGEDNKELLGAPRPQRENSTPRIHPDTMQPLLMWSLRFVETCATDIIAAFDEYQRLMARGHTRRKSRALQRKAFKPYSLAPTVAQWLSQRQREGGMLPGRQMPDGSRQVDWMHLARIFGCDHNGFNPGRHARELVLTSGLPIASSARLDTPITGRLQDRPWLDEPISYAEAPRLARRLMAACAVVIGYLSGMRVGELLNLRRGCVSYDAITQLWLIQGHHWKGVTDGHGEKLSEGVERDDPWTVVEPVARAIGVLERLHPHPLLFPARLLPQDQSAASGKQAPPDKAWATHVAAYTLCDLVDWINRYCDQRGDENERIPPDPRGRLVLSRLRRTLAWHIVRRPRGLVAGAIQYGHLFVKVTRGYAGSYDSGFPDDHAFEDWLYRLEQLDDWEQRLAAGEHVSGPAADTYQRRVHAAHEKFAGRVLTSNRQARDLLTNQLLQIFPGRAMTCVFDPAKALCQLFGADDDPRRTPDQDDCRPQCKNLAFTDLNIAELQTRAQRLRTFTADRLAPSIRQGRERQELARINTIIISHYKGK